MEEGFLNGLDLTLKPGLNVLIGARGTGTTSVIEAIRFGLGASASTAEAARRATEHAKSILRSGQVSISINKPSGALTALRSADDDSPRADGVLPKPIVFAQSEIEQVGQLPAGRLRLVDGFINQKNVVIGKVLSVALKIRSTTAELASAQREYAKLQASLAEIPIVASGLAEAELTSAALTKSTVGAAPKTEQLDLLSKDLADLSVRDDFLARSAEVLRYWDNLIGGIGLVTPQLESWTGEGADPIADLREPFVTAEKLVERAYQAFSKLKIDVEARRSSTAARRTPIEDNARKIRTEIEALKQGAGQAARRVTQLKERLAQLKALEALALDRAEIIRKLSEHRNNLFAELEALREQRFDARKKVAAQLNKRVTPRIKVKVTRAAEPSEYERVLTSALRGSGLKYNDLISQLTAKLSPREMVEAAEANDFAFVSRASGIAADRAARLVSHLRESDLGELAVVDMEDVVDLYLLDGGDYKPVDQLSTGQRCTVVLPILLEHRDRILILDQPEDHIDNAFIVDTVIKTLAGRDENRQIIISTHNANIPVLGNADHVIHLASDGRVGFVRHSGPLESAETINAITGLMEGGIEAFRRRGQIYDQY